MSALESLARHYNRMFPIGPIRALTPRSNDTSKGRWNQPTSTAQLQTRIEDTIKGSHMAPQNVKELAGMIRRFGANRQHQALLVTRILKAAINAETVRQSEATKASDRDFHEQRLRYYRKILATMIKIGPRRFPSITTMHNDEFQILPPMDI